MHLRQTFEMTRMRLTDSKIDYHKIQLNYSSSLWYKPKSFIVFSISDFMWFWNLFKSVFYCFVQRKNESWNLHLREYLQDQHCKNWGRNNIWLVIIRLLKFILRWRLFRLQQFKIRLSRIIWNFWSSESASYKNCCCCFACSIPCYWCAIKSAYINDFNTF